MYVSTGMQQYLSLDLSEKIWFPWEQLLTGCGCMDSVPEADNPHPETVRREEREEYTKGQRYGSYKVNTIQRLH